AHAEVADIVEKDHAGGARRITRRTEESTDEDIGAARLVDDRGAEAVEFLAKALAAFGQSARTEVRTALDDDAGRLTGGVRIDDADAAHEIPQRAFLVNVGRVSIALRMSWRISSRSRPAIFNLGARTFSLPCPVCAAASLMYCTSFGCVSRCNKG